MFKSLFKETAVRKFIQLNYLILNMRINSLSIIFPVNALTEQDYFVIDYK